MNQSLSGLDDTNASFSLHDYDNKEDTGDMAHRTKGISPVKAAARHSLPEAHDAAMRRVSFQESVGDVSTSSVAPPPAFIPTYTWQVIKNGQSFPEGLQIEPIADGSGNYQARIPVRLLLIFNMFYYQNIISSHLQYYYPESMDCNY